VARPEFLIEYQYANGFLLPKFHVGWIAAGIAPESLLERKNGGFLGVAADRADLLDQIDEERSDRYDLLFLKTARAKRKSADAWEIEILAVSRCAVPDEDLRRFRTARI
jgi:hypothetical protein